MIIQRRGKIVRLIIAPAVMFEHFRLLRPRITTGPALILAFRLMLAFLKG